MCHVCAAPLADAATGRERRFCSTSCRVRSLRDGYRDEVVAATATIEAMSARIATLEAERAAALDEVARATDLIAALTVQGRA